jgi:hypothetical protein
VLILQWSWPPPCGDTNKLEKLNHARLPKGHV